MILKLFLCSSLALGLVAVLQVSAIDSYMEEMSEFLDERKLVEPQAQIKALKQWQPSDKKLKTVVNAFVQAAKPISVLGGLCEETNVNKLKQLFYEVGDKTYDLQLLATTSGKLYLFLVNQYQEACATKASAALQKAWMSLTPHEMNLIDDIRKEALERAPVEYIDIYACNPNQPEFNVDEIKGKLADKQAETEAVCRKLTKALGAGKAFRQLEHVGNYFKRQWEDDRLEMRKGYDNLCVCRTLFKA